MRPRFTDRIYGRGAGSHPCQTLLNSRLSALALLVAFEITLAFLVAYLVTGRAY